MEFSILDYVGKYNNGVLVSIGLIYEQIYYDAHVWYGEKNILLDISEELETKLGYPIEEYPNYVQLMEEILNKLVPYSEMINRLDDL